MITNFKKNEKYSRFEVYKLVTKSDDKPTFHIAQTGYGKIGDELFISSNQNIWQNVIFNIQNLAKIFLSMAMAAIGLSTNLKEIKKMGFKPFIVGFIAMITVGLVSIIAIQSFTL